MTDPERLFADLIHYNEADTPFVDRYSQFGVVFEDNAPIGPGTAQVRSTILHQPAADALLTLWMSFDSATPTGAANSLVPVTRRRLSCLPWVTHETATVHGGAGVIEVTGCHTFLDERRLLSTFALLSRAADQQIRVCFVGRFSEEQRNEPGVLRRFGIDATPDRAGYGRADGDMVEGGLQSCGPVQLPAPALRIRRVRGFAVAGSVATEPHWMRPNPAPAGGASVESLDAMSGTAVFYEFDAGMLHLETGREASITFVTELSVGTYLQPDHAWIDTGDVPEMPAAIDAARSDFLKRIAFTQPPQVDAARTDRAWRARWALTRTGYQARGRSGEFAEHIASTCVPIPPTSIFWRRCSRFWNETTAIGRYSVIAIAMGWQSGVGPDRPPTIRRCGMRFGRVS